MRVVSSARWWLSLGCAGCGAAVTPTPPDASAQDVAVDRPSVPQPCTASGAVDLLVEVDNTGSMRTNQAQLAAQFATLIRRLGEGADGAGGQMRSLHLGVISTDLGTPGSTVPSCVNSDVGDDGLLNPIRQGQAVRGHQPWTLSPPGLRPARCTTDPDQYPTFLTFAPDTNEATVLAEDFACLTPFGGAGCGLEQQLEGVYRALVHHDAHARAGNTDPNAGFLRDDAVLAVLVLSDEEDGSVRDCRYAERDAMGRPLACTDAISVFDSTSADWASPDLNLRFYMYAPGAARDPTWPLDRYVDPRNPARGYLSIKPGHPDWIVFGAITGVPLNTPQTPSGGVDWDALLGRAPDGSDGYTGASVEGPVSMRQANMDANCTTRVVPACRREGSFSDPARPACDTNAQYFAWPGRRIASIVRRFDEGYGNGSLGSACRTTYAPALVDFADHVRRRLCR